MAIISERKPKVGNLIKSEFWASKGWARQELIVNLTADSVLGTVVKSDEDGTYSTVAAADVAGLAALTGTPKIAIVMDYETEILGTGDKDVACLTGGPGGSGAAEVADGALVFADALDDAQKAVVYGILGEQAIRVLTQVVEGV